MELEASQTKMSSPSTTSSPTSSSFVRCPPFCDIDCTARHHPLLVVLLNCSDTNDKSVMMQRLQNLEHVINTYQQVGENKYQVAITVTGDVNVPCKLSLSCNENTQSSNHVVVFKQEGSWNLNSRVPDALETYRYPMVHWACALGQFLPFLQQLRFP